MINNSIHILLTSDIHIGMNDTSQIIPEKVRLKTFRRIVKLAEDHDILLIAGDLFDGISIDHKILNIVQNEFSSLRDSGTEIFLTPGSCELTDQNVPCPFLLDLNITHVFYEPAVTGPQVVEKNGHQVYIYGVPAGAGVDLREITRSTHQGFQMGLFHAGFNIIENAGPAGLFTFNRDDLKSLNLDFYALGSNHNFKMFKTNGQIIGAYPGSPEAVTMEDKGDRYVLSLSVNGGHIAQIKRLTVNSMQVLETTIDCASHDSTNSLLRMVKTEMPQSTIRKLVLTGKRDFILDETTVNEFSRNFFTFHFIDRSEQTISSLIEEYQDEDSVRGEFYRLLKESYEQKIQSGDLEADQLIRLLNTINNGSETGEELLYTT